MKHKSQRCSTGHGTGTIMPETTSWPPVSPHAGRLNAQRTTQELLREARQANAKLGDYAKKVRADRDEQEMARRRNADRIAELERDKQRLERSISGGFMDRLKTVFGLRRKARRG